MARVRSSRGRVIQQPRRFAGADAAGDEACTGAAARTSAGRTPTARPPQPADARPGRGPALGPVTFGRLPGALPRCLSQSAGGRTQLAWQAVEKAHGWADPVPKSLKVAKQNYGFIIYIQSQDDKLLVAKQQ